MKLNEKELEQLQEVIEDASSGKLDRINLIIDASDVSDEVKDKFKSSIELLMDSKEEEEVTEEDTEEEQDIASVLNVEGMKDYIESLVSESLTKALEEKEEEKETDVKDDDDDGEKEDTDEKVEDSLVGTIMNYSLALKVSEINQEDIEGSSKAYKISLKDKSEEELKELHVSLDKRMKETFSSNPTESLEKETISEDNPKDDSKEEKPKSDTQKVLTKYFN